jgi:hypothetical protein
MNFESNANQHLEIISRTIEIENEIKQLLSKEDEIFAQMIVDYAEIISKMFPKMMQEIMQMYTKKSYEYIMEMNANTSNNILYQSAIEYFHENKENIYIKHFISHFQC